MVSSIQRLRFIAGIKNKTNNMKLKPKNSFSLFKKLYILQRIPLYPSFRLWPARSCRRLHRIDHLNALACKTQAWLTDELSMAGGQSEPTWFFRSSIESNNLIVVVLSCWAPNGKKVFHSNNQPAQPQYILLPYLIGIMYIKACTHWEASPMNNYFYKDYKFRLNRFNFSNQLFLHL